jgi:hypothetical protein
MAARLGILGLVGVISAEVGGISAGMDGSLSSLILYFAV